MSVKEQARTLFRDTYGGEPAILVMAPGRVNLIGEHTDYQNGYVCPMALEKYTSMAASYKTAPKGFDPVVRCTSKDFAKGSFSITNQMAPLEREDPSSWMNYLIGVVNEYLPIMLKLSISVDINLTIVSNVPFGSGLSSSAALETAMAKLMEGIIRLQSETIGSWNANQCIEFDFVQVRKALMKNMGTEAPSAPSAPSTVSTVSTVSKGEGEQKISIHHNSSDQIQQVLLSLSKKMNAVATSLRCQKAEHVYGGVQCGIMDQYVSSCATPNNAIMIDCATLESFAVPMPSDVAIIITKTNVHHSLGDSAYNERVKECNDAVKVLNAAATASLVTKGEKIKSYTSLRDVDSLDELNAAFTSSSNVLSSTEYSQLVLRRAQHVVGENRRVKEFRQYMIEGDYENAGKCMYASHDSLKNNYEVSCTELDELVAIAKNIGGGVYGARMTGGGFGGCTVTMVKSTMANQLRDIIESKYIQLHPEKNPIGRATYGKQERLSFVTKAGMGASILEPSRLNTGYYADDGVESSNVKSSGNNNDNNSEK
jgi:galactokinase